MNSFLRAHAHARISKALQCQAFNLLIPIGIKRGGEQHPIGVYGRFLLAKSEQSHVYFLSRADVDYLREAVPAELSHGIAQRGIGTVLGPAIHDIDPEHDPIALNPAMPVAAVPLLIDCHGATPFLGRRYM